MVRAQEFPRYPQSSRPSHHQAVMDASNTCRQFTCDELNTSNQISPVKPDPTTRPATTTEQRKRGDARIKSNQITNVISSNKSKEDFIWLIKKDTHNRECDANGEAYHALLKMFVDADNNKDDLVWQKSFSKLVDKTASILEATNEVDVPSTPRENDADATSAADYDDEDTSNHNDDVEEAKKIIEADGGEELRWLT